MHRCPQVWHARALELLRALIRVDTTNPPGNETEAAQLLQVALEPAGVQTQIIESAPGRGNLVARLRGSGEAPPLMLMGHLDVVPADASNWTYPPFAATVADDFVWGRGSTDMKQMIAMSAVILLCLAESAQTKGPLKRDIVLVATADEERGGRYGMRWLVNERPDLLDACCAINEGGGTPLQVGETLFFTCQTAEKGVCRSVWTACSKGGHGAYPREDLATLQLARGLARLGDGHLRSHVCATMRRALAIIAGTQSDLSPRRVERLLARGKIEAALEAAGLAREVVSRFRALFNDTAAVTVLEAGQRGNVNVIPSVARAYVDGRILPGQTQVGYLELLRERAGDSVEIALHDGQYTPGIESPADASLLDTMSRVIADHVPGARVIPWMCAGSTDAKHLIPKGMPVYGFIPAKPFTAGIEGAGAHASDERLWLESLRFGLDVLYDVVVRFASERQSQGA